MSNSEKIERLKQEHEQNSKDVRVLRELASACQETGKTDEARMWALKMLEIDPGSQEARDSLVSTLPDSVLELIGKGDNAKAVEEITGLLGLQTDEAERIVRGLWNSTAIPVLVGKLSYPDQSVREQAQRRLAASGDRVAPRLTEIVSDWTKSAWLRHSAALVLDQIGPESLATVVETLARSVEDPDWRVRHKAVQALAELGPRSASVLNRLIPTLKDERPEVRRAAESALRMMCCQSEAKLSVLLGALSERRRCSGTGEADAGNGKQVRRRQLTRIAELMSEWEQRPENMHVLRELAKIHHGLGKTEEVQLWALKMLVIDSNSQDGRNLLAATLSDDLLELIGGGQDAKAAAELMDEMHLGWECYEAVRVLLDELRKSDAVPVVIGMLRASDYRCNRQVMERLLRVGKPVMPVLMDLLWSGDLHQTGAAQVIGKIGGIQILPALTKALMDQNPRVRAAAACALGGMGLTAEPAVPFLIEKLRDQIPGVRSAAAHALGDMGPQVVSAVPALIEALDDEDSWVRRAAGRALSVAGPAAVNAVPVLEKILSEDSSDFSDYAAYLLGAIGPRAATAVPILIDALDREDGETRDSAAIALGWIGPRAEAAVPALANVVSDEDYVFRRSAVKALVQIRDGSPQAVAALRRALDDRADDIRAMAALGLMRIAPGELLSRDVRDVFAELLSNAPWRERKTVVAILGGMGHKVTWAVPLLRQVLKDSKPAVARAAERAMRKMRPQA